MSDRRGFVRQLAYWVGKRMADVGVFPQSYDVDVHRRGEGIGLRVSTYLASERLPFPDGLYADLRHSPLIMHEARLSSGAHSRVLPHALGSKFFSVDLRRTEGPLRLDLDLAWPSRDEHGAVEGIILPAALPWIGAVPAGLPLPRMALRVEPALGLSSGGVEDPDGQATREAAPACLQAILSRSSFASPALVTDRLHVRVNPAIAPQLRPTERERIERLIGRILQFEADLFGVEPVVTLMVAPHADFQVSHGSLYTVHGLRAFGMRGAEGPYDLNIASRIAGIWWDVGCRIVGPHRHELERAIRDVAALLWCDRIDDDASRDTILSGWRTAGGRSRALGIWQSFNGMLNERHHARMASAIYDALRDHDHAREVLTGLTRRSWGTAVSADYVVSHLQKGGVRLP